MATGTLDANDEVVGPVYVGRNGGSFDVHSVSGTITVTLERSIDNKANFVAAADGAYTAAVTERITAPGWYRLKASGVSSGSATATLISN